MTSYKQENPLISVIVPNFNHARFLRKRLDSIIYQSYSNIEIILLDDASTDDSREVLAEYAANDSRIHCHYNEVNSGSPFRQWQKGIDLAYGEYIWIAESDDFADSTFLETLVQILEKDSSVGVAYCRINLVDALGAPTKTIGAWQENDDHWVNSFSSEGLDEIKKYPIAGTNIPNASAVLFRKSIADKVDKSYASYKASGDWFFWIEMMRRSRVVYTPNVLSSYRWHNQNVTSTSVDGPIEVLKVVRHLFSIGVLDRDIKKKVARQSLKIWFDSSDIWGHKFWESLFQAVRLSPMEALRVMMLGGN